VPGDPTIGFWSNTKAAETPDLPAAIAPILCSGDPGNDRLSEPPLDFDPTLQPEHHLHLI